MNFLAPDKNYVSGGAYAGILRGWDNDTSRRVAG